MTKGSGKRATRKRVADVSAAARDDAEQLKRAATRRLAKLEKDLLAVCKTEERRRARLAAASAEADRLRNEILELVRHVSEPQGERAPGDASKVGHAAGGALDGVSGAAHEAAGAAPASAAHDAVAEAPVAAKRATPRPRKARPTTPPATGPGNG